eukprot:gene27244-2499_t
MPLKAMPLKAMPCREVVPGDEVKRMEDCCIVNWSTASSTRAQEQSLVAALDVFPFCSCIDYRCGSAPYDLIPDTIEQISPDVSIMCFTYVYTGCVYPSQCCQTLTDDIFKMEFSTEFACTNKQSVINTTINGETKMGSTFFDTEFATAKIRITNLQLKGQDIITGSKLCLWVTSPCDTFEEFFENDDGTFNPPLPVIPKPKTVCDCISIYEPNTRWRLNWRGADTNNGLVYYRFGVTTAPAHWCAEVTYREGYCCNSTMDTIELSMDPIFNSNYFYAFKDFWIFDVDNIPLVQGPVGTGQKTPMGLSFAGFGSMTVDDIPPGSEMTLTISMDPAYWNDTSQFPCGPSRLVEQDGVCDYALHGLQVRDGGLLQDILGPNVPQCCPEGVYIENPEGLCGCSDNKLLSPWRLAARPAIGTTFDFRILSTTPQRWSPLEDSIVNCNAMDLDRMRLYIHADYVDMVTSAIFDGESVNYTFGNDGVQYWIELRDLMMPYQQPDTVLPLVLTVSPDAPMHSSMCGENPLGSAECEYVFFGKWNLPDLDYQCCAHGYSEPDFMPATDATCCDANKFHSPYSVEILGFNFDRPTVRSTLTMSVKFNAEMCVDSETNAGCCDTDVKTMFMEMKTTDDLVSLSATPSARTSTYYKVPGGVMIEGDFGTGTTITVSIVMFGNHNVGTICTGSWAGAACHFQLHGGYTFNAHSACCASHITTGP